MNLRFAGPTCLHKASNGSAWKIKYRSAFFRESAFGPAFLVCVSKVGALSSKEPRPYCPVQSMLAVGRFFHHRAQYPVQARRRGNRDGWGGNPCIESVTDRDACRLYTPEPACEGHYVVYLHTLPTKDPIVPI